MNNIYRHASFIIILLAIVYFISAFIFWDIQWASNMEWEKGDRIRFLASLSWIYLCVWLANRD